jgi:hypothetical protein
MSQQRFLELEKKRKIGKLSADEKRELRGAVTSLNLLHANGDQYCYCETSGFACNPQSPPPGCNCICVPWPPQ